MIVEYYRKQLQESTYYLYTLQQKYECSFSDFEQRINTRKEEDFEEWDDYISWKGHMKSAATLADRIKEIENGFFKVA